MATYIARSKAAENAIALPFSEKRAEKKVAMEKITNPKRKLTRRIVQ